MFHRYFARPSGWRIVEIGCAPGRWLVFFAEVLDYTVTGLDYSPIGARLTRENFRACGVRGEVLEEDLFETSLADEAFDVVLSLGVVEHFEDPRPAIRAHTRLLKSGGLLAVGLPNLRSVIYPLQRLAAAEVLRRHNLEIMRKAVLQRLLREENLHEVFCDYIGAFEPALLEIPSDAPKGSVRLLACKAILRGLAFLFRRWPQHDSAWYSQYLLAVYRKDDRLRSARA